MAGKLILGSACFVLLSSSIPGCAINNVRPEADADSVNAGLATTEPSPRRVMKGAYLGPQPRIMRPTNAVLRKPLPYLYCGDINQFVFFYLTEHGVQYYRLRPVLRESYRDIFNQVIAGTRFPWALRQNNANKYFVNAEPETNNQFDYQVSIDEFNSCAELENLEHVQIVR